MKLLISAVAVIGLAGCSTTWFDPVEYNHWVELKVITKTADDKDACGTGAMMQMNVIPFINSKTDLLSTYTKYRDLPAETKEVMQLIQKNTNELSEAYSDNKQPSIAYCRFKLHIIDDLVERMLITQGGRVH